MTLTSQQQLALNLMQDFITDKDNSIFILKGYAGTGKTTMIEHLVPIIEELGKVIFLMAPTGRAAKVLREKARHEACTIHHQIYEYSTMEIVQYDKNGKLIQTYPPKNNQDTKNKGLDDMQIWYSVKSHEINHDPTKSIVIVDEASMINSRPNKNEYIHFGTDILIDDLLTYVKPNKGGKVIFVGDPAQLPPVGDNRSVALEESYFLEKGLSVKSFELTEVLRQKGESVILKNAMQIRDLLYSEHRNRLCFERKKGEVEDILTEEIADSFYENFPNPNIGDSVILCYTNSLVKDYNDAMRHRYFPDKNNVTSGDILQVVCNSLYMQVELFNGDFVKVLEVSDEVETLSAPVWIDVAGEKKREPIKVHFRDAVLLTEDGKQLHRKIVDDLLGSRNPNLTYLEHLALYINFLIRHPKIREDEKAFKDALMNDPYYNALHVKYGYAITVHKSQGGEWEKAYIDYSGRTGLNNDSLRWAYTATTRAGKILYGVNMPSITPISALKFRTIAKISNPSKEAFSYADAKDVDFLPKNATASQKQKCICVNEQLDNKGFLLRRIQPSQYNDKYTIETPSGTTIYNCYYKSSGMYTKYIPENILPENETLMAIFNNEDGMQYDVKYKPSNDSFAQLYAKISSLCDDLGITITNIVEHTPQYYLNYYLKTSGKFSSIQFYFTLDGFITYGLPSSDLGQNDKKLQELINRM